MLCNCEKTVKRGYYTYYDTPDGCDIGQKMLVTSRYGAIAGIFISVSDVLMFSHATGLRPVLKRYAMHIIPLSLMGATFSLVANTATQFRQKDDHLNYFLGGLACGPIAGFYIGNGHAFLLGGIALGVIAMVKKEAVMRNFTLFPTQPSHRCSVRSWRNNYTLKKDPLDELRHICGKKDK